MARKRILIISIEDELRLKTWSSLPKEHFEFVSTGETARKLQELGADCALVEHITGFPKIMDGQIGTLHPRIVGGILADHGNSEHLEQAILHNLKLFDIVVVELGDFASSQNIERINIEGSALIRSAAKNAGFVTVICDPADDAAAIHELTEYGLISGGPRAHLAAKAFATTGSYDQMVAEWMVGQIALDETLGRCSAEAKDE